MINHASNTGEDLLFQPHKLVMLFVNGCWNGIFKKHQIAQLPSQQWDK